MKKILIIVGAVVLAVALAAGSFYGGMAYQRNQADQVRANFLRSRGFDPNAAGNNANGQARRGFFGGGLTGQVKSVDGNSLTVSTAQNVATVNLSSTTQIEKADPGALTDLQPGEQVLVTGQLDASGNITATQVLILGNQPAGAPAGTPATP